MPVYNGEQYLVEAIESILNQTISDFEFIIIDDASRDSSMSIVREFARNDERILLIENQRNLGVSVSLNKGIRVARGEYIARMDSDDLSAPQRFEAQVAFMDANKDVGVCGTWVEYIGDRKHILEYPTNHDAIYARMLFENALAHPSVMMRKALLEDQGLFYDEDVRYALDYELWSRAIFKVKFANIDRILLQYRIHQQSISSRHGSEQHKLHDLAHRRLLAKLGFDYTDDEIRLHQKLSIHLYGDDVDFMRRSQRWLEKISASNKASQMIPQDIMDAELAEVWGRVCYQSPLHPVAILFYILLNPLRFHDNGTGLKLVLQRIWSRLGRRGLRANVVKRNPAKRG